VKIAIEGVDCSGKATQSRLLADKLGAKLFSFPAYETPAGKAILGNLKSEWDVARREQHEYGTIRGADDSSTFVKIEHRDDLKLNALILQALMTINRFELAPAIEAAACEGHVVFDRFSASALIYGTLDGLDPAWIESIQASLPKPNLWILLDVPVEEGFRRRPERRDRYESDRSYLEKVREGYLKLFSERAKCEKWVVVDGRGTIGQVHARIWEEVGSVNLVSPPRI